jgi:hypothetical protein
MLRFGRINYFINGNIEHGCKSGDSRPGKGRIK